MDDRAPQVRPRSEHGRHTVAITDLPPKTGGVVHRVRRGRRLASRLAALGFSAGAEVTVVRNDRSGPLIVLIRGTRVALGRGEAAKVFVEVAGDERDSSAIH